MPVIWMSSVGGGHQHLICKSAPFATCFSRVDNAIKVTAHRSLTQIMQKHEKFPPELGTSFVLKAVPGLARDRHELSGMCCPDGSALCCLASMERQMRWKEGVLGLEKEDTILEPGFWHSATVRF